MRAAKWPDPAACSCVYERARLHNGLSRAKASNGTRSRASGDKRHAARPMDKRADVFCLRCNLNVSSCRYVRYILARHLSCAVPVRFADSVSGTVAYVLQSSGDENLFQI